MKVTYLNRIFIKLPYTYSIDWSMQLLDNLAQNRQVTLLQKVLLGRGQLCENGGHALFAYLKNQELYISEQKAR